MFFYMPTKVYSEISCVKNHGAELAALGSRALLVTGRHSAKANGSLADVQEALREHQADCVVFDEIEENPSMETVIKARDFGLAQGADFVIGIGGGSPMDAAKAIALMMKHPKEGMDYLYAKGADSSALPVAEIPTTCGTGSEVTPYAILTIHAKRTKSSLPHKIYPALALSDPSYLKKAPFPVIQNTAVDALGHFLESYINSNAGDCSKMLVTEGLRLWSGIRDVLSGARKAEDADYAAMLNAATLGGMAITHTGTSLPHGLSYYVTYEEKVAHGKAVGVFLPGYLKASDAKTREKMLALAGFGSLDEFRLYIRQVLGRVEMPQELRQEAQRGLMGNPIKLKNCPFAVTEEGLKEIIEYSLDWR